MNPQNCLTTVVIEYRVSPSGPWEQVFGGLIQGGTTVPVQAWALGLQPSTTYEFRVKASSAGGSAEGSTLKFTTPAKPQQPKPPIVTNEAASGVTSSSATLKGSVNPNGQSTTYEFEYGTTKEALNTSTASFSAGSGSSSTKYSKEVLNLEPGTLYYFRISATNPDGTSTGSPPLSFTTSAAPWQIKETPNPEGADYSILEDVSCMPSTSRCTVAGTSTTSGVDSPLTYRWNGESWSVQTPAKKTGAVETRLSGVDCPSETRCLAVGSYEFSGGQTTLMSELWNENKWSNQTTPTPAESTSSEFVAIGCNSTANCTAVGSAVIGGKKTAIAERWTSPNWATSSIPIPEGAQSSQLDGVDCLWSNFCVAVGRYTTSGGAIKSLALYWNGEWKLQTPTDPENAQQTGLRDVSCTPSPNRCTAVGEWRNKAGEQLTLAYRFNGSTWTLQSTPNPPESIGSVFEEVSCATETSCAAVGIWHDPFGEWFEGFRTLAANWNGSSWSIQSTQNPVGAPISTLLGVSCQSSSCYAVGLSAVEGGTNLALFRE